MTSVQLARRALGGALLGLPAALLAHTLAFRGDHAAGGSAHSLFLELASAFAFLVTLLVAICAAKNIKRATLRLPWVLAGSVLWFAAIEGREGHHGVPVLLVAIALLFASWIVRAIVRAFEHTAIAVLAALWSVVLPAPCLASSAVRHATPRALSAAHRFRMYSRPPPRRS